MLKKFPSANFPGGVPPASSDAGERPASPNQNAEQRQSTYQPALAQPPIDWDGCDRLGIDKIVASGKHGVTEEERAVAQPLEIALALKVDLRAAGKSDDLSDTVNYSSVHKRVVQIVETTSFKLLERLAGAIVEALFEDQRVLAARISIGKPARLRGATPTVTLVRSNPRVTPE